MKIETRPDWTGIAPNDSQWTAIDTDTYSGPGSLIGSGATQAEAIADLREKMRTPLTYGAPAYTIRVTRLDYLGRTQHFEFDGYGLLRELMDDIEAEADKRGWFEDTNSR